MGVAAKKLQNVAVGYHFIVVPTYLLTIFSWLFTHSVEISWYLDYLREINFEVSRSSKSVIFTVCNFGVLSDFSFQKFQLNRQNQNSDPLKMSKLKVLYSQWKNWKNWGWLSVIDNISVSFSSKMKILALVYVKLMYKQLWFYYFLF